MSMVGIAYANNHILDHPEIVDLLVTGFSGTLREWWDTTLKVEAQYNSKIIINKVEPDKKAILQI